MIRKEKNIKKKKEKKKEKKREIIPQPIDDDSGIEEFEGEEVSEMEDMEESEDINDSQTDDFKESPEISVEVFENTPIFAGTFLIGEKRGYFFRNRALKTDGHPLNEISKMLKEKSKDIRSIEKLLKLQGKVTSKTSRTDLSKYYITTPEGFRILISYFTPAGRKGKNKGGKKYEKKDGDLTI